MNALPEHNASPLTEAYLVSALTEKLIREGYRVRREVSNMGQSVDLVAIRGRWVTVFEVKMGNWRRALLQCRGHEQIADFLCVAIGTVGVAARLLEAAQKYGYGVIHFDRRVGAFRWTLRPRVNRSIWLPQRRYWARLMREVVVCQSTIG